jgi:hypothetical protein
VQPAGILVNQGYIQLDNDALAGPAVGLLLNLLHRNVEHAGAAIVTFVSGCGSSAEVVARATVESSVNILYILAGHSRQRAEKLDAGSGFLDRTLSKLLPHFADGNEIDPARIRLRLKRVTSETVESDLFRLASLTWSVPVSTGFGRRLRYLVWDDAHDRLAGIIALGDPVVNLSVRDNLIGWTVEDRSERLVHLLDAYVLGAVPPYSALLGGKAAALPCALERGLQRLQSDIRRYGRHHFWNKQRRRTCLSLRRHRQWADPRFTTACA